MATGGELSRTLEGGHETFYDFPCSLCETDERHVEAVRYCEECFVYLCEPCVRNHNKFPLNTRHQLLDQSQFVKVAKSKLVSFPTKRCLKHTGELITIYCGDHDVVCCGSCRALDHNNCAKTRHLIDAAKGIKKSEEYQTIKQETRALLNNAVRVLADRTADMSRIKTEKQDVKQIIADIRKKVNKYFDDLEQRSLDALNDKSEVIVNSCRKDKKDLAVMKSKAEDMLKQLESFKGDNECDLFVQVKTGKKFLGTATQEVLDISKTVKREAINFRVDPKIDRNLSSIKALGTFTDIPRNASQLSSAAIDTHVSQPRVSTSSSQTSPDNHYPHHMYETQIHRNVSIVEKQDTAYCEILDICQLPDGKYIITDCTNTKLKRLDHSYKHVDSLRLADKPQNICNAGSHEIALSLCEVKKVQFISVEKELRLTRSFCTGNYCRGMVYVDDKLYVCCGSRRDSLSGSVEIYNSLGQLRHSIDRLSSIPERITITDDGQHLLVTSFRSDNITMMDLTGKVVNTYSNRELKKCRGICTDGQGQVFVCGKKSNTVVQLEPRQQKIDVILGEKDGVKKPIAIFYDRKHSRVLVSCYKSNQLLVYNLK
ncbi:uncharacterized protein LOC123542980 [Mercenaria mercenaria]|uniref:uncharacterized protein LOC123542980 n=1 Tax=Mercenaria mercenaria TaxID=6596 RepID=UPI00234F0FB1|nr:uncharacterized protein LOC123542980 [Mercenaria mercenaria]